MLLSKSEVRDSKKSKSIKEQKASRLLSSLGIKTISIKQKVLNKLMQDIK